MTQGIIIAGGKGHRLRPVTEETAKALITVNGRSLIDNTIDLFYKYEVYEIWMSLGWKQQQIRDKYTLPFWIDAHTETRKIIPLGTGGWLNRLAQSDGYKRFDNDFFVCNADNLFNLDLREMMKQHKRDKNIVTIAVTKVPDVREYGSVHIKNGYNGIINKVASFEEKKNSRIKKSGFINGGYYIFSPKIFEYAKKLNIDINEPFSLETQLFPILAKEGVMGAYKSAGQWFDTGTFERWEKAIHTWDGITDG